MPSDFTYNNSTNNFVIMKDKFKIFDNENPEIYKVFKKYAFQAKAKGFKRYGSKGIIELIRWHTSESGNDGYKINNNYAPYYADKLISEHPEFDGFFRRKVRKSGMSQ